VVGYIVSKVDFSILWRYFTWANQTTAMVMLWTAAAYLYRYNNRIFHSEKPISSHYENCRNRSAS